MTYFSSIRMTTNDEVMDDNVDDTIFGDILKEFSSLPPLSPLLSPLPNDGFDIGLSSPKGLRQPQQQLQQQLLLQHSTTTPNSPLPTPPLTPNMTPTTTQQLPQQYQYQQPQHLTQQMQHHLNQQHNPQLQQNQQHKQDQHNQHQYNQQHDQQYNQKHQYNQQQNQQHIQQQQQHNQHQQLIITQGFSCKSCKHKKTKCSKHQPSCQQCVLKGFVCEYPSGRRPRTKPIEKPSDNTQHKTITITPQTIQFNKTCSPHLVFPTPTTTTTTSTSTTPPTSPYPTPTTPTTLSYTTPTTPPTSTTTTTTPTTTITPTTTPTTPEVRFNISAENSCDKNGVYHFKLPNNAQICVPMIVAYGCFSASISKLGLFTPQRWVVVPQDCAINMINNNLSMICIDAHLSNDPNYYFKYYYEIYIDGLTACLCSPWVCLDDSMDANKIRKENKPGVGAPTVPPEDIDISTLQYPPDSRVNNNKRSMSEDDTSSLQFTSLTAFINNPNNLILDPNVPKSEKEILDKVVRKLSKKSLCLATEATSILNLFLQPQEEYTGYTMLTKQEKLDLCVLPLLDKPYFYGCTQRSIIDDSINKMVLKHKKIYFALRFSTSEPGCFTIHLCLNKNNSNSSSSSNNSSVEKVEHILVGYGKDTSGKVSFFTTNGENKVMQILGNNLDLFLDEKCTTWRPLPKLQYHSEKLIL